MAINNVFVSGNLTRDPEKRQTQSGMPVITFGIAVNERKRVNEKEFEDYANFFDCVMFGERANKLFDILSKGSKVSIAGKLRYSSWEKDGQKRSKVEIVVNDIELHGTGKKGVQEELPFYE